MARCAHGDTVPLYKRGPKPAYGFIPLEGEGWRWCNQCKAPVKP